MKRDKMKCVIMGGGSAGTTCAFELRKLNKDLEIVIIEKTSNLEYSPCALPYVISKEIKKYNDIFIFKENDYISNDISLLLNSEVSDIDRKNKTITYEDKNIKNIKNINYDFLVIATGSKSFVPPIKGIDKSSFLTLKTIEDAKKISSGIKKGTSSVIIGGGLIGIELAVSLSKRGEKVTVIEAKGNIFSSILDSDMADKVKVLLEDDNIIISENENILKIEAQKIYLKNKTIHFDNLFFCTGMTANVELAKKIGLNVDKAIIVNEFLQTSDKNIFACGDCVESVEFNSPKKIVSQLGTTAVRQAKVIARNMVLDKKTKFNPVLNNTVTKIGDFFVASVGLTIVRSKELGIACTSSTYSSNVRSEYYPSKSKIAVKLVCSESGTIIGGQIIGNDEVIGRINTISLAIQKKCHIKELAEMETCYNPASAPIFDPLTIAAEICVKKLNLKKEGL